MHALEETVQERWYRPLFWAVFCLGLVLRVLALDKDLSYDETTTLYAARQPLPVMIADINHGMTGQSPLFALFVKGIITFSDSPRFIRMILSSLSLYSLIVIAQIAGLLFGRNKGALLSMALAAFNYQFIIYSVDIRAYPLWVLSTLLSVKYFIEAVQVPSVKNMLLFAGSTAVSIGVHLFGFFLLPVTALFLFVNRNRRIYPKLFWVKTYSLITILIVPVIIHTAYRFLDIRFWAQGYETPDFVKSVNIISALAGFLSGRLCAAVILVFTACSLVSILKDQENSSRLTAGLRRNSFALIFFLTPIIALLAMSLPGFSVFHQGRYYLPYVTGLYWIIGFVYSLTKLRFFSISGVIIGGLVFVHTLGHALEINRKNNQLLYETAETLRAQMKPGEVLMTTDVFRTLQVFNELDLPFKVVTTKEEMEGNFPLRYLQKIYPNAMIAEDEILQLSGTFWVVSPRIEEEATAEPILSRHKLDMDVNPTGEYRIRRYTS